MAWCQAAQRCMVHDAEEMQPFHAHVDFFSALQGLKPPLMLI